MVSEDSRCTAAREASSAAAAAACSSERRCAAYIFFFKITCNGAKQNNDFVPIKIPENSAASKTHPLENAFFCSRNHLRLPAATMNTKGAMSHMHIVRPTEQLRSSPPGSRGSEHMPLYPSCVCLPGCSVSRAMASSALEA